MTSLNADSGVCRDKRGVDRRREQTAIVSGVTAWGSVISRLVGNSERCNPPKIEKRNENHLILPPNCLMFVLRVGVNILGINLLNTASRQPDCASINRKFIIVIIIILSLRWWLGVVLGLLFDVSFCLLITKTNIKK